jgi:CRP-like cAMP-binding protein
MSELLHPVLIRFFPDQKNGPADQNLQFDIRKMGVGDVLFSTGDSADSLFFILEGRLAVHKSTGIRDRTQVVALLDAGTIVGESAVSEDRLRGATVIAVEKTIAAQLSRQDLVALEETSPRAYIYLMKKILRISSLRLHKSSERLALVL